jgi:hypothetical protein
MCLCVEPGAAQVEIIQHTAPEHADERTTNRAGERAPPAGRLAATDMEALDRRSRDIDRRQQRVWPDRERLGGDADKLANEPPLWGEDAESTSAWLGKR